MNNFVFNTQDPLLYQSVQRPMGTDYSPQQQQFDTALAQYQAIQQNLKQPQMERGVKDHLGELDDMMKDLDDQLVEKLNNDAEFTTLNAQVQKMIQDEIMRSVRWKINSNPDAVAKIDKLKAAIRTAVKEQANEDKRNMMELNDYLNNYSSMSFDDYKRIKSQKIVGNETN